MIYKKLSKFGFMGIPLTSQEHSGTWYVRFSFKNKDEWAVVSQARVMSVARLYTKMGEISEVDYSHIRQGFCALYS